LALFRSVSKNVSRAKPDLEILGHLVELVDSSGSRNITTESINRDDEASQQLGRIENKMEVISASGRTQKNKPLSLLS
jgi:hypothetical protein